MQVSEKSLMAMISIHHSSDPPASSQCQVTSCPSRLCFQRFGWRGEPPVQPLSNLFKMMFLPLCVPQRKTLKLNVAKSCVYASQPDSNYIVCFCYVCVYLQTEKARPIKFMPRRIIW